MAAFGEEDLDCFFTDFAEEALWKGKTIPVIFHNEYEAVSLFSMEIASAHPFIEVKDLDIEGLVIGDPIKIKDTDYEVKDPPQADGTGISILILTRV
jgi:hypothetical protein